jgi:hypothetical protein
MVEITLYNNGLEVKGHTDPLVCGEVSILTWACANSIYYLDDKSDWNGAHGELSTIIDLTNEKAVLIFNEFKRNLGIWAEKNWLPSQVRIIKIDGPLEKIV